MGAFWSVAQGSDEPPHLSCALRTRRAHPPRPSRAGRQGHYVFVWARGWFSPRPACDVAITSVAGPVLAGPGGLVVPRGAVLGGQAR